jgi:hypothetical protein
MQTGNVLCDQPGNGDIRVLTQKGGEFINRKGGGSNVGRFWFSVATKQNKAEKSCYKQYEISLHFAHPNNGDFYI